MPDTSSGGSSGYEYFVSAVTVGDSANLSATGTVESNLKYTIGLKSGYTWKITAGIRRKSDAYVVMSDTYQETIDTSTPALSKDVYLTPESGRGTIDLAITVDSSVNSISIAFSDSDSQSAWDTAMAAGGELTTSKIHVSNLLSGNYFATLYFCDLNGAVLYSVKQFFTVYPAVTTNKWVASSDSSSVIDSSGNFNISSDTLKTWERSLFYVSNDKIFDNPDYPAPSDDNLGSAYAPLASITGALNKIIAADNENVDYTIYVAGTITENVSISTTKMKSLTIQNLTGKTAIVDGNASGSVFSISTDANISVKLEGITIQNGKASKGAGIFLESGKFEAENCIITDNHATASGSSTSASGGALYVATSSNIKLCKISNCTISNNTAKEGAGFQILAQKNSNASVENSVFENNIATSEGGAVKVTSGKYFTIIDCELKNNKAVKDDVSGRGGAVYITGTGELMLGGNIIIPYDDTQKINDVYICSNGLIKVTSQITSETLPAATITPESFSLGTQLISGTYLADNYSKFAVSSADYIINPAGKITLAETITDIYLSSSGNDPDSFAGITKSNHKDNPFKTIKAALQFITYLKDGSVPYSIHVAGTLSGTNSIPASDNTDADKPITIDDTTVTSITIDGTPEESSDTNGVLDGDNSSSAPVLAVSASVPVTLTNLTITKGKSHGIQIGTQGSSSSDPISVVKIGNGTVISGNSTNANGGGVVIEPNGQLYMYGNAIVGESALSPATSDSYSNYADNLGGGIYCNGGKLYIGYIDSSTPDDSFTGGVIHNYTKNQGGGIYTAGDALVNIYNGSISYNGSLYGGAGIRCGGSDTLNLFGGSISNNEAGSNGGGIYIGSGSILNMEGGTISDNTAGTNGGAICNNTGTLNISNSAYIPAGSEGKNAIYLALVSGTYSTITVTGSLNPPDAANGLTATITPAEYAAGIEVLRAAAGVTLSDEVTKFAVTPQSISGTVNPVIWTILNDGNLSMDIVGTIESMTSDGSLKLYGDITSDMFTAMKTGLDNLYAEPEKSDIKVSIDLSDTTGLTSIPIRAFDNCTNLSGIIFPDTLESISGYAFNECINLKDISFPNSLKTISSFAFYNCSSLTSISFPDGITSMGERTFYGCKNIEGEITIPSNITTIGEFFFYNCKKITKVNLPAGLTRISNYVFSGCSGLTEITIPSGVNYIGIRAFENCSNLTGAITIPSGVTILDYETFKGCSNITSITLQGNVTEIKQGAFQSCKQLASINIPDSLTTFGKSAFSTCWALTSINIPYSVTSIPESLFSSCKQLATIEYAGATSNWNSLVKGNNWNNGCPSTMNIKCLDSNNTIVKGTIDATTITALKTEIMASTKLVNLDLSETTGLTLLEIDQGAFDGCTNLSSIILPSSLEDIRGNAFSGCTSLVSVVINSGTKKIQMNAFVDCTALSYIRLPETIEEIHMWAFEGCYNLTSINYDSSENCTVEEWGKIDLTPGWNTNSGITKVICTDGEVTID